MKNWHANFDYKIKDDVLVIEDLDYGNKSVTNDMVNVLKRIEDETDKNFIGKKIIYKDSEQKYDGVSWNGYTVSFIPIRTKKLEQALTSIKNV